jgi:hypothetical protein
LHLSSKEFPKVQKEVHEVSERPSDRGLDFGALRLGIEGCDPDRVLGFYAEDAQLSIVNVVTPHVSPFELRGKAEIAKHLRAVFGQEASHRVEGEVVGKDRVRFREACEYPDGSRIMVETTLEVHDGKIVRQADVVAKNAPLDREEEISRGAPLRSPQPWTSQGVDAPQPDHFLRFKQATEKEV